MIATIRLIEAFKRHTCISCSKEIPKGENYVGIEYAEPYTQKRKRDRYCFSCAQGKGLTPLPGETMRKLPLNANLQVKECEDILGKKGSIRSSEYQKAQIQTLIEIEALEPITAVYPAQTYYLACKTCRVRKTYHVAEGARTFLCCHKGHDTLLKIKSNPLPKKS